MITWAIDRAGFQLDDFAEKFPKVLDWLNYQKTPTVKQLEDFSRRVYLPFGYLFLPQPPVEKSPIPFYRTGKAAATDKVSLNVQETVRLLKHRQDWLADYLQENGEGPLPFVGKFGLQNTPEEIAADIRNTLNLAPNWASHFPNWSLAKAHFAQKIEDLGIVLSFNGVVENNNHRKIDPNEVRGFVLVDEFAPFLFVNAADSKAAQMFTMAHELAHVWTGKSAGFDSRNMLPADDPMEQLCDQTAAELLVPSIDFRNFWQEKPQIAAAARHFKVSEIVAARRALDLGLIDKNYFFGFYNNFMNRHHERKLTQPKGGNHYNTQKVRLGLPFLARLNQALKSGKILHREVYQLTGLRGDTFHKLTQKIL
ncbi:MAG: ImmA/IrrE family metallo-endopeptidase [Saprospiraceae bacterium]